MSERKRMSNGEWCNVLYEAGKKAFGEGVPLNAVSMRLPLWKRDAWQSGWKRAQHTARLNEIAKESQV